MMPKRVTRSSNKSATEQPSPSKRRGGPSSPDASAHPSKKLRPDSEKSDEIDQMIEDAAELLNSLRGGIEQKYIENSREFIGVEMGLLTITELGLLDTNALSLLQELLLPTPPEGDADEEQGSRVAFINAANLRVKNFLEKYASGAEVDSLQVHKQTLETIRKREAVVQQAARTPAPDEVARSSTIPHEETGRAIPKSRPFTELGGHIEIYHPVLSRFAARVSGIDPTFTPETEHFEITYELLQIASDYYPTAESRYEAIVETLSSTLGCVEQAPTYAELKADGVMIEQAGKHRIPLLIMDVENELGDGGCDSVDQCVYLYQKLWSAEMLESIRGACCCPCFLLCISGPWFVVLGAIIADDFVVEVLTNRITFSGSSQPKKDHLEIGKFLAALKISVAELREFYKALKPRSTPNVSSFSPAFQKYGTNEEFQLIYTSGKLPTSYREGAMFDAWLGSGKGKRRVRVKFTRRYSERAHRLLADKGLAPQLRHCATSGDWTIVVMDLVNGKDLASSGETTISPSTQAGKDIEDALSTLHANGLVFGDLRPHSVMIRPCKRKGGGHEDRAMLVNFDWAGEEGEAHYPYIGIMRNKDFRWPEGIRRGEPIQKEHDIQMYDFLTRDNHMDLSL